MESITAKLSKLLGITNKESETMIKNILASPSPQEDLLDLLGDSCIEEVAALLMEHRKKTQNMPKTHKIFTIEEKLDKILAPKLKRNSTEYYEEYILDSPQPTRKIELIPVGVISKEYRDVFSRYYKHFNRVQSAVLDSVYNTRENVLVSAPTGAGKTDIALLAIVKQLEEAKGNSRRKIIYIAPMKALAAEITGKFRYRLPVIVSECTGDTELTKEELEKSTVLVCTPEKYDVTTRKISSYLLKNTSLVILDEIHILNDTRGPTIEAIVCRLKLLSEKTENPVRLVGISATLPNPKDIAGFLSVKPAHMHVFTPGDRPVPIRYSVIGTKKTVDTAANGFIRRMDTKEKMLYILKERIEEVMKTHNQAIVFVHTRGNTLSLANYLSEDIDLDEFKAKEAEEAGIEGEMKDIYSKGVFIHNAGLSRSIREFAEDKFRKKKVRILVSTSTLAWGVNLPARTVIVFGTEVYSAEKGGYVDLGVLDIQ